MRNTNNQLIESVRALLRDVVLPELQSDIARTRLRQIMATLRDVDWDDTPLALLRENAALQAWLEGTASASGTQGTLATDARPSFAEALTRNQTLRRRIADRFGGDATASGWTKSHADAARLLADCARSRGSAKRRTPQR